VSSQVPYYRVALPFLFHGGMVQELDPTRRRMKSLGRRPAPPHVDKTGDDREEFVKKAEELAKRDQAKKQAAKE